MPRWRSQNALPMRCTYLDTDVLAERLIGIYGSEDKFQLVLSTDRYILYSDKKLTKEQLKALSKDPEVYSHYPVPGDAYHVGSHHG